PSIETYALSLHDALPILWRRTTLDSYRTEEPEWEVLLDVDALGAAEGESWVWHGASLLRPAEGEPYRRALVTLSRGGSDADVTRDRKSTRLNSSHVKISY